MSSYKELMTGAMLCVREWITSPAIARDHGLDMVALRKIHYFLGALAYRADGPSRREQRRARKAAKNAYMWRTFGARRKWNENRFSRSSCGRYPMRCGKNDWVLINANDTLYLNGAHGLRNVRHDVLAALREPSGFKAMSRLATEIAKGDRGKKSAQELSNEIWSGII